MRTVIVLVVHCLDANGQGGRHDLSGYMRQEVSVRSSSVGATFLLKVDAEASRLQTISHEALVDSRVFVTQLDHLAEDSVLARVVTLTRIRELHGALPVKFQCLIFGIFG